MKLARSKFVHLSQVPWMRSTRVITEFCVRRTSIRLLSNAASLGALDSAGGGVIGPFSHPVDTGASEVTELTSLFGSGSGSMCPLVAVDS